MHRVHHARHTGTARVIHLHPIFDDSTMTVFHLLRTNDQNDCDVLVNWNKGCTVKYAGNNTYGADFNKNGGGW